MRSIHYANIRVCRVCTVTVTSVGFIKRRSSSQSHRLGSSNVPKTTRSRRANHTKFSYIHPCWWCGGTACTLCGHGRTVRYGTVRCGVRCCGCQFSVQLYVLCWLVRFWNSYVHCGCGCGWNEKISIINENEWWDTIEFTKTYIERDRFENYVSVLTITFTSTSFEQRVDNLN